MDYYFVENNPARKQKKEILMTDASVTLPTDVPVGSVAYTADLSYMAIYDGTNWVEIGGSD